MKTPEGFTQTRAALLSVFCGRPNEQFHLRELIRSVDKGSGSVQREVARLTQSGLITKTRVGNRCFYQGNTEHPSFAACQTMMSEAYFREVPDVIRGALNPLKHKIKEAFIYGSVARRDARADSDIDLMIVGDTTLLEVVRRLDKIEGKLNREINPTVYTVTDFRKKIKEHDHFLSAVLRDKKTPVIGSRL